ncbi:hypothetical protein ACSVDA_15140 [Cytobacillus sp. Hm23]
MTFHRYTLFSVLIFTFALIGCSESQRNEQPNASIVTLGGKTISSVLVTITNNVNKPQIYYTSENIIAIQTFVAAIKDANRMPGIVDVSRSDYVVSLNFEDESTEQYFLWLDSDSGSIMNRADTHTLYTLPLHAIEELNEYIK